MMKSEATLDTTAILNSQLSAREEFSDYVAHLQLHMTLQARNLVPSLTAERDSRQALLHDTQASIEKMVSRQRH